jgi:hypothetical protein
MRNLLTVAASAALLNFAAPTAHATIIQVTLATFPGVPILDQMIDDSAGPITASIGGTIAGDFGDASAAIGPSGDLGMSAHQRRPGNLRTAVGIRNDFIPNLTGTPRNAQANFIIDGGQLALVGGLLSDLHFILQLGATIYDADNDVVSTSSWFSSISIVELGPSSGGRVTTFQGEDIGAAPAAASPIIIEIPSSLQTFDIGLVPSSGYVDLVYRAEFESLVSDFAELVFWEFSDPLSVDGASQFPTVSFLGMDETPAAVPAPAMQSLLAVGLLLVGLRRYARISSPSGEAA